MQASTTPNGSPAVKSAPAALTAQLVHRTYFNGRMPIRFRDRARSAPRTLAHFHALLRTPHSRLFISVSSTAFVFVLGLIG